MDQSNESIPSEKINVNGVEFSFENIFIVVENFYSRVQKDTLLQTPFQSVHDWPEHIDRIAHFWWVRMGGRPFRNDEYDPVLKHYIAGFNEIFLSRWLELFHATLSSHLNAEQIKLWTLITQRMGNALSMKNEFYKKYQESKS